MTIDNMAFTPADGLKNASSFPTVPADEAAARKQIQDIADQLKDYLNNVLTSGFNAHLADNVKHFGDNTTRSAFFVYKSAIQTLTNSAANKILFQLKDFDHLNEYDNITNHRFTASEAGIYLVTSSVYLTGYAAGSIMEMQVYKNGVRNQRTSSIPVVGGTSVYGTFQLKLSAGDYLEIYVFNGSASGVVTTDIDAGLTFFEMIRIA